MLILSIETSCDETAISLIKAEGEFPHATYEILGDALWSQIDVHKEYGGVFPALAKREHAAMVVPMLKKALDESDFTAEADYAETNEATKTAVREILDREPNLADKLLNFQAEYGTFPIDIIAATNGPGLEPALWVGVNFARALALLWNIPVVPVNHMEGHILASIFDADRDNQLSDLTFPTIALLISGGHTELILMKNWSDYKKIGQTRDDAVGEAFDKVARMVGIPYPGGPEFSNLASVARKKKLPPFATLPTPMLHSGDLDFSFSGLKTAVRYAIQDKVNTKGREGTLGCKVNAKSKEGSLGQKTLASDEIAALARDFEDAVATVLVKKTTDAITENNAKTLIVGGGVSANLYLKRQLETSLLSSYPNVTTYFPAPGMATDNSIMIALVGHAKKAGAIAPVGTDVIRANGNRSL